ncbi:putative 1,3-beta-glucan synthase [Helianthus annuus]|nr:putative 1,3-beta-glucan synthase [Helianthus annuus]KAJ0634084.1 putative 1,3-beta-glucan synthase [Helianthus annuus]KAJ0828388.1 putative 1,3-beta-glucan synthase [Helianthus annuus]
MRENYATWNMLIKAWKEGRLFQRLSGQETLNWLQIRRLHSLFTIKDSAVNVPRNLDARRRLEFFTNSLFMNMPRPQPVREMLSFSVFTPYYSETVLYSINELLKKTEDGISILFYLQKVYPDEWKSFLAQIGRDENTHESVLIENEDDNLELRFWASYRGQTLSRTVRGMMYYRKARFNLIWKNDCWSNARTLPLEVVQNLLSSTSMAARLLVTMVSSYLVVTI